MGIQNLWRLLDRRGDDEAGNYQTLAEESLKNGRRWQFTDVIDLASDGTEEVVIDNTYSERVIRVVSVLITPDDQLSGTVDANVSIDSAGTPLSAQNGLINDDVADTPDGVTVESGGTYSGGEAPLPFENAGGEGDGAARTALSQLPVAVNRIDAGHSLRFTLNDESSGPQDVSVEITISVPEST